MYKQTALHFLDGILKIIFLNANRFIFSQSALKFVARVQLRLSQYCLSLTRRQAIIWLNDALVYWRMYASLGLNELTEICRR